MLQFHVNGFFGLQVKQINDQSFYFPPNCNGLLWFKAKSIYILSALFFVPSLWYHYLAFDLQGKPFITGCGLFWKAVSHWLLSRVLTYKEGGFLKAALQRYQIGRLIKYGDYVERGSKPKRLLLYWQVLALKIFAKCFGEEEA